MRFAVEFSDAGTRDIDLIFDHLVESYVGFGDDFMEAVARAEHRALEIRKAAGRLATFRTHGTSRDGGKSK